MLALSHSSDDLIKKFDTTTISRRAEDEFLETGPIIYEFEEGTKCEICEDTCPGFKPHAWRKTCQACKCPRANHAIYQEQMTSVCERIGFKSSSTDASNNVSKVDSKQLGYAWVPPGLISSSKIQQYFNQLPAEKVPKINSKGEQYRHKMLMFQLPKQDLASAYCKYIDKENIASYEDFVAARNEIALDIGYVKDVTQKINCNRCTKSIQQNDVAVFAPKLREQMTFHPNCFTCSTCNELLVDLTYCVYEDKLYCERHYAEILKPRCSGCDEESQPNDTSTTPEKDSKHDFNLRKSPLGWRRSDCESDGASTPDKIERKLLPQESECLEDSEEATLLHNLKEEKLGVDVDNQYLDDPQIKEMTDYVKKLTKAKSESIDEGDGGVDAEYYWKPPKQSMTSWESTEDLTKETYVSRKTTHTSGDGLEDRRPSLAEMIIIPKTVTETPDDLLIRLENEALEYQHVWGLNTPDVLNSIKKRHDKRSQSISMGVFTRQRSKILRDRRRESVADALIIPKTYKEDIDEEALSILEKEATEYQEAWGLDNPEDMQDIERRYSIRSQSISMGVLSRQKNKLLNRRMQKRDSIAETIIVPRMSIGSIDEETLKILENEALEYQQVWGLDIPNVQRPLSPLPHKIDYNEWYDRFDCQTTAHLETTFTDDEEEEAQDLFKSGPSTAEIQIKNRIYHTFSGPTTPVVEISQPLLSDDNQEPPPPVTPADYDTFMQKFPEQLSPEIHMQDGRRSPASLETYLDRMKSPSPKIPPPPTPSPTRALTPVEHVSQPPSLEVYLQRMKSTSPAPSSKPK